jgi:DNA-binding IclR family transcriptional regulator
MRLLLAFVKLGGRGHMLKVLAAAAGMPPSKAHRYLVSFIRMGLVERDPVSGYYRLGPTAVQIGVSALAGIDAVGLSVEAMIKLHDELNHTIALSVWGKRSPVIVRVEEDDDRLMAVGFRIGKSLPLLTSAAGQLFAAFLPRSTTEPVIREELRANQAKKGRLIRSMAHAQSLLKEVRARGMSRISGDLTPGICVVAAPVFDHRGYPATVISAIGPIGGMDVNWHGEIARAMKTRTSDLSKKLGFSGPA